MMVTNMVIMNRDDIDYVDINSAGGEMRAGYDKVLDRNHFQPLARAAHMVIMITMAMNRR